MTMVMTNNVVPYVMVNINSWRIFVYVIVNIAPLEIRNKRNEKKKKRIKVTGNITDKKD